MPVTCSHCGEELLGAVNCCWKCGKKFALRPEMDGRPPFRRPPVPEPEAAAAPADEVTIAEVTVAEVSGEAPPTNIRRGSPFATSATLTPAPRTTNRPANASVVAPAKQTAPTNLSATSPDRYSEHVVSIVAAVLSVVLGLASLALCGYFPIGALAVAVVGLAMGVWGLYSDRRGVAVIGVILCCVALSISGFRSVVQLYKGVYGYSPWETEDEQNLPDEGMDEGQ